MHAIARYLSTHYGSLLRSESMKKVALDKEKEVRRRMRRRRKR